MTPRPGYFAQFGEDIGLERIFPRPTGVCVEVGAFDGVEGSMTLLFERKGWCCLLIEPDPEVAAVALKRRTSPVLVCACGATDGDVIFAVDPISRQGSGIGKKGREIIVPMQTLDSILEEARFPTPIDFITIDTEGTEYGVLQGFSLPKWRPRIIIIENNGDKRVHRHLVDEGYWHKLRTGVNDWYVRADERTIITLDIIIFIRKLYLSQAIQDCIYRLTRPLADRLPQSWKNHVKNIVARLIEPRGADPPG